MKQKSFSFVKLRQSTAFLSTFWEQKITINGCEGEISNLHQNIYKCLKLFVTRFEDLNSALLLQTNDEKYENKINKLSYIYVNSIIK